jgi:hypothetical protein
MELNFLIGDVLSVGAVNQLLQNRTELNHTERRDRADDQNAADHDGEVQQQLSLDADVFEA